MLAIIHEKCLIRALWEKYSLKQTPEIRNEDYTRKTLGEDLENIMVLVKNIQFLNDSHMSEQTFWKTALVTNFSSVPNTVGGPTKKPVQTHRLEV